MAKDPRTGQIVTAIGRAELDFGSRSDIIRTKKEAATYAKANLARKLGTNTLSGVRVTEVKPGAMMDKTQLARVSVDNETGKMRAAMGGVEGGLGAVADGQHEQNNITVQSVNTQVAATTTLANSINSAGGTNSFTDDTMDGVFYADF